MKKFLPLTQIFIFILLFTFSACTAQVVSEQKKVKADSPKNIVASNIKLLKNHFTDDVHASADNVHCGLQDKNGNLWFGTTGDGIYKYDGKLFTNYTTKNGLSSNCVWSVLEDKNETIWFGTSDGICRFDGKEITHLPLPAKNIFKGNAAVFSNNILAKKIDVTSILQDKSGIIWFGTSEGVYCYDGKIFTAFLDNMNIVNNQKITLKNVQSMLQDKKGNIWFGSGPMAFEEICLYDGKTIQSFKPNNEVWIRNILEDKNGMIWFTNRYKGITRYNGKTFTKFGEEQPFNTTGTGSIINDKNGNIWFSSLGKDEDGGVWFFDGKNFKNFTKKDGLGNNSVFFMMEDKAGNIWMGTRSTGLYCYNGKTFTRFSE